MIRNISFATAVLLILAVAVAGCGKGDAEKKSPDQTASALPDSLLLKSAPADAKPAAMVWEKAKTGDKVAVTGVIGGRKQPFTDGAAAFTIVDRSLEKCTDDHCDTPWDYCCEPPENLKKNMLVVEFRDGANPYKTTARGFHGLDHMKNVVITGEAKRDEAGNVVIVASGVFVEP